jgi:hypothetical protein
MNRPYSEKLTEHYAGAEWSINDEQYDSLQWYSDTPKPSKAELDALD